MRACDSPNNPSSAGRRSRWKRILGDAPALTVYALMTVYLTWPLATRFTTSIYGFPADNVGSIWLMWWIRNAGAFNSSINVCPLIGFPFGTAVAGGIPVEPVQYLLMRLSLLVISEVPVHNMETMLSFFLSGVTMYYLVRYLTGNKSVAFFGGLAYLVMPYHAFHSMVMGGGIMAVQWMPLYILLLLKFIDKPGLRSAAFLSVGAILVAGTSVHNGLFMAIFTVAFLFGRYLYRRLVNRLTRKAGGVDRYKTGSVSKRSLALALSVVLLVVALAVPLYSAVFFSQGPSTAEWPVTSVPNQLRVLEFVERNAAKPTDYFRPVSANLLFRPTGLKPGVKDYDFYQSIYLGWVLLILAMLGVAVFISRDRLDIRSLRQKDSPEEASRKTEAPGRQSSIVRASSPPVLWGFVSAALVAFLLSLKPVLHVGTLTIPLPSKLFLTFIPWFRWYMRLGVVVGICFIVIACFGLSWILGRFKGRLRYCVLVALAVVMVLEMMLVPPFRNYDFSEEPEVFAGVAELADDSAVVFYPLLETGLYATSHLQFFQRVFKKPMLNGAGDGTKGEALRRTVINPYNPDTPRVLKRFGFDYMVFFEQQYDRYMGRKDVSTDLAPGFELIERFDGKDEYSDAALYKITASEAEIVPIYMGNITVPVVTETNTVQRLVVRNGIIRLLNYTQEDTAVSLKVPLENPFPKRRVAIVSEGVILWEDELEAGESTTAVIENLTVPVKGVDLELFVQGPVARVSYRDFRWFGSSEASLIIGELHIELVKSTAGKVVGD